MNQHHALLLHEKEPLTCDIESLIGSSPDRIYRLPKCTVADVRTLVAAAWLRPAGEEAEQCIVVATEFIIEEAQQALLKIVEEPPLGTRFVFVVPEGYTILPTLQSRFQVLAGPEVAEVRSAAFNTFLHHDYKDRMVSIETALKQKDMFWQKAIKEGLRLYLLQQRAELNRVTLEQLQYVLETVLTRGASNKFLFEQLALVLPIRSPK